MPRRGGVCVVVVMPAFARCDEGNEPVVAGVIASFEAAAAPHVCRRIHQPGAMQTDYDTQKDAPQYERYTAEGSEQAAQHNHGDPMIVVEPDVEAIFHQIRRILRVQGSVAVLRLSDQQPAHVSPPAAVTGRVWVAGLVGLLVVQSMHRYPEYRPAFECQRSTNSKEILQSQGHLI